MAANTKLTKAELIARIDAVQEACAAEIRAAEERVHALDVAIAMERQRGEALQRECDALYSAQRPSRRVVIDAQATAPVINLRGVPHYKLTAWEGGRLVTTYRPVQ